MSDTEATETTTEADKDLVTIEGAKAECRARARHYVPHHSCVICGDVVGYEILSFNNISPEAQERYDLDGDEDIVPLFNSNCSCVSYSTHPRLTSWTDFIDEFNRQTLENRKKLWQRFVDGKPLFDPD